MDKFLRAKPCGLKGYYVPVQIGAVSAVIARCEGVLQGYIERVLGGLFEPLRAKKSAPEEALGSIVRREKLSNQPQNKQPNPRQNCQ